MARQRHLRSGARLEAALTKVQLCDPQLLLTNPAAKLRIAALHGHSGRIKLDPFHRAIFV